MSLILWETGRKCIICKDEIENETEQENSEDIIENYSSEQEINCSCCGPEKTGKYVIWPLEYCLNCADKNGISKDSRDKFYK